MRLGPGKDHRILAQTFREMREMLGLPQPAYARLFEVERALVQELEEGKLPAALDHRLLKIMLLSINLQKRPEIIKSILREMNSFYGLDHIFERQFPIIALYEQVLGLEMARYPWIAESINFNCKAIKRKRIGSFLLLWTGHTGINTAVIRAIPQQVSAFISFIGGRTLLLLPSQYLFLNLDTSHTNNPVVKEIESTLDKREPIGFALARQIPSADQLRDPNKLELDQLRLFAYSQEVGMLKEATN
jgi:hypothetical protein